MSGVSIAPQHATLGNGCFWCTEAVFSRLPGILKVTSGYMGGHQPNPDYRSVCEGTTGHAEVIQLEYNPKIISYEVILQWFWKSHDPTTLNRQGNDRGTQYRSVIFIHNEEQRITAEQSKTIHDESGAFSDPIVTQIEEASQFYPAEPYHHDYFKNHPEQGYCQVIINPKLQKLGLAP